MGANFPAKPESNKNEPHENFNTQRKVARYTRILPGRSLPCFPSVYCTYILGYPKIDNKAPSIDFSIFIRNSFDMSTRAPQFTVTIESISSKKHSKDVFVHKY